MMKKISRIIVLSLLISVMSFGTNVFAAEGKVTDNAGLLSESEISRINDKITELENETGWEIFVVTTEQANGLTTTAYNESWLDENLQGDNGVSYIIDMDNREFDMATTGDAIYYLIDTRISDIMDAGGDCISEGDYAGTFLAMLNKTGSYYKAGIPKDQYTYDSDTGNIVPYQEPKQIKWYEALIAVALAAGAFGITFGAVTGKYRLKWGKHKYDYRANSIIDLTNKEDRFVNQIVTKRHIPKNDSISSGGSRSSGSRSTVHTGSGGRSYGGGGGRKF